MKPREKQTQKQRNITSKLITDNGLIFWHGKYLPSNIVGETKPFTNGFQ